MMRRAAWLLALAASTTAAGWFESTEHEGERLFRDGHYAEAAKAFRDPYRRGVAQYRAGEYAEAARSFESSIRPDVAQDARYNLGNARFRQGDIQGAAAAWSEVLAKDSGHTDAGHNLGIARALLARIDARQAAEDAKKQQQESAQQQ